MCSQCHFPMGLPVSTYLGYKILQPKNDISSGKDTFCYLFILSLITFVNTVVKVVPEYPNWTNIHVIYRNVSSSRDIYVYKS